MSKLENFIDAFDCHIGSCYQECHCGKKFYNPDPTWDFEEGELEKLEKDQEAVSLDYSVGMIEFEGNVYVMDCVCWREQANRIMNFIDSHAHGIADYLNSERERKLKEAEHMPQVNQPVV